MSGRLARSVAPILGAAAVAAAVAAAAACAVAPVSYVGMACDAGHACPEGLACVRGRCGGSATGCDGCRSTEICVDGRCVPDAAGAACGCSDPCPSGFECPVDAASGTFRCVAPEAPACDGPTDCLETITGAPAGSSLRGLARDADGNLYVADDRGHVIWAMPAGSATLARIAGRGVAGYTDGPPLEATFVAPWAVAVLEERPGTTDVLLVADREAHCVRRVAPEGVTTFAGICGVGGHTDGADGPAQLHAPIDLLVRSGDVLVLERTYSLVRAFPLAGGPPVPVAGLPPGQGGITDCRAGAAEARPGLATETPLGCVGGMALEGNRLYLAEEPFGLVWVEDGQLAFDGGAFSPSGFSCGCAIVDGETTGHLARGVDGRLVYALPADGALAEATFAGGSLVSGVAAGPAPACETQRDGPSARTKLLRPQGIVALPDGSFAIGDETGVRRWSPP